MISENNNELNAKNENGQPTDGLTEEAVMTVESVADNAFREEFPEGFDELSDEDLIADLEALADELQDFPDTIFSIEDSLYEEDSLDDDDSLYDEYIEFDDDEPITEEDFFEEEIPEEEETPEEEVIPEAEHLADSINDLVDELEENLAEEEKEETAMLSSDDLLQLADDLSDGQADSETAFDEAELTESELFPMPEERSDVTEPQEQSAEQESPFSGTVELDSLAAVMNTQNDEAYSFLEGAEETSEPEESEVTEEQVASSVAAVELNSLAEVMNVENGEAVSFIEDDDDDGDVKVFVKKTDAVQESEPAQDDFTEFAADADESDAIEQLDKTIVNLPVSELFAEEQEIEDIGQTSVFEPVRPQPAYGETGGRNSAYYYDDEKPATAGKKKKGGFFRGFAAIAGLLVAVVFISWLLSLVAFSVMGADDSASAEEYDYSTTSTIIKPFNDDQPEPVVVPEFTAEKLTTGDTGEMVDAVQRTLASLGYLAPDKVSGTYDSATEKAVTQFQKANYLEATGEVDSQTYALIFDANATAPTTRTTDLPTTTEASITTTEMSTQSTPSQTQSTAALTSEEATKPTSATPSESKKTDDTTDRQDKTTDTEPTKPTTETPSSQEESTTESTKSTTAADAGSEPVG